MWVGNLSKAELADLIGFPGEETEEQERNYQDLFGAEEE